MPAAACHLDIIAMPAEVVDGVETLAGHRRWIGRIYARLQTCICADVAAMFWGCGGVAQKGVNPCRIERGVDGP